MFVYTKHPAMSLNHAFPGEKFEACMCGGAAAPIQTQHIPRRVPGDDEQMMQVGRRSESPPPYIGKIIR